MGSITRMLATSATNVASNATARPVVTSRSESLMLSSCSAPLIAWEKAPTAPLRPTTVPMSPRIGMAQTMTFTVLKLAATEAASASASASLAAEASETSPMRGVLREHAPHPLDEERPRAAEAADGRDVIDEPRRVLRPEARPAIGQQIERERAALAQEPDRLHQQDREREGREHHRRVRRPPALEEDRARPRGRHARAQQREAVERDREPERA